MYFLGGRAGGEFGRKGTGGSGRKEGIPIQSANHSDEPPKTIIVSAMASTMI